jgi:hypothetical protein
MSARADTRWASFRLYGLNGTENTVMPYAVTGKEIQVSSLSWVTGLPDRAIYIKGTAATRPRA